MLPRIEDKNMNGENVYNLNAKRKTQNTKLLFNYGILYYATYLNGEFMFCIGSFDLITISEMFAMSAMNAVH